MNQLNEARAHLSHYEKLKGSERGLAYLSEGMSILFEVLAEDCPQDEKTTVTNVARTYRKDALEWCQELLSGKARCSAKIDNLYYCRLLLDCFNNINRLIGHDKEYGLLEKKLLELTIEPGGTEVTVKGLVDRILLMSESKRNEFYTLLKSLGLDHIHEDVAREENKRLKANLNTMY